MTNEQLCALVKQGDADVQNLLIEKNLRFVKKTAHEVWSTQPELNCSLHMRNDEKRNRSGYLPVLYAVLYQ